jgi:hypothetical protein
MPNYMNMKDLKAAMERQMAELGYKAKSSRLVWTTYSVGNEEIEVQLTNANPKKFEILVSKYEMDGFLIDSTRDDDGKYEAHARFSKTEEGVTKAIQWMARAHRDHQHLLEIMEPDKLRPPFEFTNTGMVKAGDRWSHGMVLQAQVHELLSLDGIRAGSDIERPDAQPWFRLFLNLAWGCMDIISEGDHWYPVVALPNPTKTRAYRILTQDCKQTLNQRDRELIHFAISQYLHKVQHQEESNHA